jgi:signal transduction histidine kinase
VRSAGGEHLSLVRETDAPAGVRIEADLALAETLGDPTLVARLVTNLIDNALRHNVPDGWVRVSTGTTAGRPTVPVVNSGPEIVPEQIGQISEPFQRLHTARVGRQAGHGIGLSIVSAIAASHGAELRAAPRADGGGLDVSVAFPVRQVRPAAQGTNETRPR